MKLEEYIANVLKETKVEGADLISIEVGISIDDSVLVVNQDSSNRVIVNINL